MTAAAPTELYLTLNPELQSLSYLTRLRGTTSKDDEDNTDKTTISPTTDNKVNNADGHTPVPTTDTNGTALNKENTTNAVTEDSANTEVTAAVAATASSTATEQAVADDGGSKEDADQGSSDNTTAEGATEPSLDEPLQLQYDWVVWEQLQASHYCASNDYKQTTREIATFSTVQEFWSLFEHLPQPSELLANKKMVRVDDGLKPIDAIMIFKKGVAPMWEDAVNSCGGHFEYKIPGHTLLGQADEYWNALLLALVGGTIKHSDMVTGVRLVDKMERNLLRVELWFTDFLETGKREELKKSAAEMMATKLNGKTGNYLDCMEKSHIKRK